MISVVLQLRYLSKSDYVFELLKHGKTMRYVWNISLQISKIGSYKHILNIIVMNEWATSLFYFMKNSYYHLLSITIIFHSYKDLLIYEEIISFINLYKKHSEVNL